MKSNVKTQEEKQLLLVDLCARLPHGVKVWYKYYPTNIIEKFATSIRLADEKIALSSKFEKEGDWFPIEEAGEILIKPYLRPMSSMTENEVLEYVSLKESIVASDGITYFFETYKSIDWLNKKMFDYRGLIPNGLALTAPKGMYK